jgi:OmpA-OmpF porin, OOP family
VKILLTIILFASTLTINAQQNLVQNGSFEDVSQCADSYYQLNRALYWDSPNYNYIPFWNFYISPELYQPCSPTIINVPNSPMGGGFAPDGDNYAGGYFYNLFYDTIHNKTYFQNELLSSLKPATGYCFKMKISLGNPAGYATNDISVYFSPTKIEDSTSYVLSYLSPQIKNTSGIFYTDTSNWVEYTGSFIASGGEKYLIIGSFLPTDSTPHISMPGGQFAAAYYMIDDVQLYECDSLNSIEEIIEINNVLIYPNPSYGDITIEIKQPLNKACIEVYDAVGKLIYSTQLTDNLSTISIPVATNGIYSVRLWNNNEVIKHDKLVIIK